MDYNVNALVGEEYLVINASGWKGDGQGMGCCSLL